MRKKNSLWKEENHTRKNQFIVLPLGEDLIDITVGDPGPVTLVVLRESPKFAPTQKFKGDKAYIRRANRYSTKKTEKSELTCLKKLENKEFSASRICSRCNQINKIVSGSSRKKT